MARTLLIFLLNCAPSLLFADIGDIDPAFDPVIDDVANVVAVQRDGKVLIGGSFGAVDTTNVTLIGRINPDGSVDTGFSPQISGITVNAIAVQSDDKILIGGDFNTVNGQSRSNLARLNEDGTLDTSFDIAVTGVVRSIVIQDDEAILIGGDIVSVGGVSQGGIARIDPVTGIRDVSFTADTNGVLTIAVQEGGQILIGGVFTEVNSVTRNRIARIHENGALDMTFNPNSNGRVRAIVPVASSKILIGGDFTTIAGESRSQLARLNNDGSLDIAFDLPVSSSGTPDVFALSSQRSNGFLLGGTFSNVNGESRSSLARVGADDVVDPLFDVGVNELIRTLALQPDGKLILAGSFTELVNPTTNRSRVARVVAGPPQGSPSAVTAAPGVGSALISWTGVVGDISSYDVLASPGGATCAVAPPTTTCEISGLTAETAYTFTVTASNSLGAGPASAPSNSVSPTAPTPTPTHTPTPTVTPSITPTPLPTSTPTITPIPVASTPTIVATPCFGTSLEAPRVSPGRGRATVTLRGDKTASAACTVKIRGERSKPRRQVARTLAEGRGSATFKRLRRGQWRFFYSVTTNQLGTSATSRKKAIRVK
jgi:uncharacterized delta-60 repeat protein